MFASAYCCTMSNVGMIPISIFLPYIPLCGIMINLISRNAGRIIFLSLLLFKLSLA